MNRMLSAITALAMTTGMIALAAPANAAPAEDAISISIEGLNPANPADAVRIDRRVRTAARSLCGSNQIQPIRLRVGAEACEAAVVADARNSVELAAAKQASAIRLALRTR
ncbi:MAG: UrcA family protein [Allosphingosinicella sp.]